MGERYYLNGRYIVIKNYKDCYIIRIKPYGIYPINEDGVRIFRLLSECNDVNEICTKIDLLGKREVIKKFLDRCVKDGILTQDSTRKGEIREKSANTIPYLERVFFEITDACNLSCRHCYMSATYKARKVNEVPFEKIKEIIQKADQLGVYRMDFTGGEIFTRKDIDEILKLASDNFMVTNIFTNATMITEKRVKKLVELGNIRTIFISLDDIVESEHDEFRGVKGAFSNTMKAIKLLKKTDIKVVANITLSPKNINRIDKIIDYCRNDLEIDCRTAPILYVGRGKCFENNNLSLDQIKIAMDITLKHKSRFVSGFCDDDSGNGEIIPGCGVGHKMIYIRSNGEICLCPTLSSRESEKFGLGNIYKDELQTLWNENEVLKTFRNSSCKNSDCKNMRICRGGCRSRAFLNDGNFNGIDPIICHYFDVN